MTDSATFARLRRDDSCRAWRLSRRQTLYEAALNCLATGAFILACIAPFTIHLGSCGALAWSVRLPRENAAGDHATETKRR